MEEKQECTKHIAQWMLSTFWGVSARQNLHLYPETVPKKNEWWNNSNKFAFHMMWRIMQILEDVIHRGRMTSSSICIILQILLGPIQYCYIFFAPLIVKYMEKEPGHDQTFIIANNFSCQLIPSHRAFIRHRKILSLLCRLQLMFGSLWLFFIQTLSQALFT